MNTRMLAIALAAVHGLVIGVAYGGDTYTSNVASGNWNSSSTWTGGPGGTTPGEDDRVIILCGHTITVSGDESADSIEIEGADTGCSAGSLYIAVTKSLTIDHDNGPSGDNIIDGYINLYGDLKFVDTDQTIRGSSIGYAGYIVGYPNGGSPGRIIIAEGKKLTSDDVSIIGTATITAGSGTATFRNEGVVSAGTTNNAGTIILESNLVLEDSDAHGYTWLASTGLGATLKFKRAATGLIGNFGLSGSSFNPPATWAQFIFEADVATSGVLGCINAYSKVDVVSATFTYLDGTEGETEISADCDCESCGT